MTEQTIPLGARVRVTRYGTDDNTRYPFGCDGVVFLYDVNGLSDWPYSVIFPAQHDHTECWSLCDANELTVLYGPPTRREAELIERSLAHDQYWRETYGAMK